MERKYLRSESQSGGGRLGWKKCDIPRVQAAMGRFLLEEGRRLIPALLATRALMEADVNQFARLRRSRHGIQSSYSPLLCRNMPIL